MTKIQKLTLAIVGILMFGGVFVFSPKPVAEAEAFCYRETGTLRVAPGLINCPVPSTGTRYIGLSGEPVTNYQEGTRCYVTAGVSQGATSITYREQNCVDLETLRTIASRAQCDAAGGTYTVFRDPNSPTQSGSTCACPDNFVFSGGDCIRREQAPGVTQPEYAKGDCNPEEGVALDESNCGIIKYLVIFINLLSGLVGVVIVGSLIFAGIQYSSAGSDPQKVSAAKDRIRNSIIALIFFIFMYGFLNYLVPGGVLT